MLDRLRTPHDQSWMVAVPPRCAPVAHASGWTEDFPVGDVGIKVDSPKLTRYVAAIYIYRDAKEGRSAMPMPIPLLPQDFSHTIYTFFQRKF